MTPDGLASAAAGALALIFGVAAGAKLRSPATTRTSFSRLGLAAPHLLTIVVPALEVVAGALLVVRPFVGGVLAVFLLVGFSTVLIRVIRSGSEVPCACFGSAVVHPVGPIDVVRNLGLGLTAQFALFAPSPIRPDIVSGLLLAGVLALGALSLHGARKRLSRADVVPGG